MANQELGIIESLQAHVDDCVRRDGERIVSEQEAGANAWVNWHEIGMRRSDRRTAAREERRLTNAMGVLTAFVLNDAVEAGNKGAVPDVCFYDEIPTYRTNWRGKLVIDSKLTAVGFEGWRLGTLGFPNYGTIALRSDADSPQTTGDGLVIVDKSVYIPEHGKTEWKNHTTRPIPLNGEVADDTWALRDFCLEQTSSDELKRWLAEESFYRDMYQDIHGYYISSKELRDTARTWRYPVDIEKTLRDSLASLLVSKGIVEVMPGVSTNNNEVIEVLRRRIQCQGL